MAGSGGIAKVHVEWATEVGAVPSGSGGVPGDGSPQPVPCAALREKYLAEGPDFIMNLEESLDNQVPLLPPRNPLSMSPSGDGRWLAPRKLLRTDYRVSSPFANVTA